MNKSPRCKNCNYAITNLNYGFCPHCGQKTNIGRLNFESVLEELLNAFHFETNRLFNTVRLMVLKPGMVMLDYINGGRRKYQSPISYLFISILCYGLFIHYVIEPQHWYIGVLMTLTKYQLILLMSGLSIIGWLFAGYPKYNFFETFVIFCFVYGTSFLITPIFIILQSPFIEKIKILPVIFRFAISDLPSSLFIFYCLANFFYVAKIRWVRYGITAIVGYVYYVYFIQKLS